MMATLTTMSNLRVRNQRHSVVTTSLAHSQRAATPSDQHLANRSTPVLTSLRSAKPETHTLAKRVLLVTYIVLLPRKSMTHTLAKRFLLPGQNIVLLPRTSTVIDIFL